METTHSNAPSLTVLSIFLNVISWITLINAQYFVSFVVTILGAISAVFAIRYYYYAGNEKKKILSEGNKD
tara:strand:+ start:220 stop:429 length:210 start_codon:yes stop_codon:yes gene_type:complete